MANHPSARKRARQNLKRVERNKSLRSSLRTTLKTARAAIAEGDKSATEKVSVASRALAHAASRGVVHPRTAARTTSRIQLALNKLSA